MKTRLDYVKYLDGQNNIYQPQVLNIKTNKKINSQTNDLFSITNKINFRYKNVLVILKSYNYWDDQIIDIVELWTKLFQNLAQKHNHTVCHFDSNFNSLITRNSSSFFSVFEKLFRSLKNVPVAPEKTFVSLGFTCAKISFEYVFAANSNANTPKETYDFNEKIFLLRYGTKIFDKPVLIWDSSFLNLDLQNFLKILLFTDRGYSGKRIRDDFISLRNTINSWNVCNSLHVLPPETISDNLHEPPRPANKRRSYKNVLTKLIDHFSLKEQILSINPAAYTAILKKIEDVARHFSEQSLFVNDFENLLRVRTNQIKALAKNHQVSELKNIIKKFLDKNWELQRINTLILSVLQKFNSKIQEVVLDLHKDGDDFNLQGIHFRDTKNLEFTSLSYELNTILTLFLTFKYDKLFWNENNHRYVFIRELDSKYHPNYVIDFLKFFFKSGLCKQRTLIFTSNNSKLVNFLPPDCIYYLDDQKCLIRLSDINNVKNNHLTSHYLNETDNFSKIYSNLKFSNFTDFFTID